MFTIKVIFFDTETTGLDFRSDSIIELAMLTLEEGTKTDSYDEFIDIGMLHHKRYLLFLIVFQ